MSREKCCARVRCATSPDQLPGVAGGPTAAGNIKCSGMRLLACLALLCAVSACGMLPNFAPASATNADAALARAMALEKIPMSWHEGLRFIMEKESGGRVGIQNTQSSARGLFQILEANYNMNPNGAGSFGNGVEEAQGGIRYIKLRYGCAENAVTHWQQYRWY